VCDIVEPAEIPVGSPARGLLGSRRLVIERLQLEDLAQQIGGAATIGAVRLTRFSGLFVG
jgi:hypothetical protein